MRWLERINLALLLSLEMAIFPHHQLQLLVMIMQIIITV